MGRDSVDHRLRPLGPAGLPRLEAPLAPGHAGTGRGPGAPAARGSPGALFPPRRASRPPPSRDDARKTMPHTLPDTGVRHVFAAPRGVGAAPPASAVVVPPPAPA